MIVYLQMIETDEDKSKFEEIYQEYRNLMYYVAYKRMQHEQDAEDVVHHVFVKIAENIKNIEPVSPKTKQLIVTMFDNRVTDVFRVRGKHTLKNSMHITSAQAEDIISLVANNFVDAAECIGVPTLLTLEISFAAKYNSDGTFSNVTIEQRHGDYACLLYTSPSPRDCS